MVFSFVDCSDMLSWSLGRSAEATAREGGRAQDPAAHMKTLCRAPSSTTPCLLDGPRQGLHAGQGEGRVQPPLDTPSYCGVTTACGQTKPVRTKLPGEASPLPDSPGLREMSSGESQPHPHSNLVLNAASQIPRTCGS